MVDNYKEREGCRDEKSASQMMNDESSEVCKVKASIVLMVLLIILSRTSLSADTAPGWYAPSDADARSLQERVRELQKDVFQVSEDLHRLQEELLSPSSTAFVVMVSVDAKTLPTAFTIESVLLEIDQKQVATYIYSPREQDALLRGGVQRLYAGNTTVGLHKLNVSYIGKDTKGKDQRSTVNVDFDKTVNPKFIELRLTGGDRIPPRFVVKEWE